MVETLRVLSAAMVTEDSQAMSGNCCYVSYVPLLLSARVVLFWRAFGAQMDILPKIPSPDLKLLDKP